MSDGSVEPDGTLETIDGRPALRFERTLPHPIERVWRAVSVPAELGQWFPAAAEWTPAAGETLEAFGMSGEVLVADAPERLEWTFAGERYAFELTVVEGGCRLVFTHVFGEGTPIAQTATGWHAYVSRLGPLLDGEPRSEEEAHATWEADHERYAAALGVDPAPGRAFIAAHRARQG
ncbi:SRPBCC domain-containing protein [Patulibacter minatonensis]|uniref:SRPBCC domain-containing protein n=1 Tax=Patulibacter minatonensis TaxID=298163 RepID=UPI00056122EA|nr:SRPBCC domain-containing protein [Patulibacter minatonensis]